MANQHGSFIWYELLTRDIEAAKAFYDGVVGWDIQAEAPPGGIDYRMIQAQDGYAGGAMQLSEQMLAGGAQASWLGYIGVDDVDVSATAVEAAGGSIHLAPFDIPGAGRAAMVADPQGVPFYIMRGSSPEDSTAYQRMGFQHVAWNELQSPDDTAALAFYEKLFGITKVGAMPMGAMGDYSFIANGESAGEAIGAVMRAPGEGKPGWGFYFRVPDIHAAKARVEELGGTVHHGPTEVPGGEMTLQASDPEGIFFGLVAPGKES
ncbi:MAG: VOC family protein [Sphingomonadales bacterium]|nr:MAG: VOC family protein [Sphingomonadales bacterium]